ncbi:hypothetical protein AEST_25230 [Alishewanella aestuarii B11]|uniref:DarT domain-containing protein n=1 Tax=Alishewanella aestuarii B11 TaxID=1197174 RepID=J1Y9X6_9ALTE|nr:DUF4433 domain-containing protein [Alishewanella aestuarii]EJI84590.1 hypothetical protein AEST_25230 [Alishewanella aestuarii B11]
MLHTTLQHHDPLIAPDLVLSHVWHLTHVNNLPSVFNSASGLLSKHALQQQLVSYQDISMTEVQTRRARKTIFGIPLHNFVPTFVQQRNPMMSKLRHQARHLVWLKIDVCKLTQQYCITADRNAAADGVKFYEGIAPEFLPWHVLMSSYWNNLTEGSALRSAEILVLNRISPSAIVGAEVCNPNLISHIEQEYGLAAVYAPNKFFL